MNLALRFFLSVMLLVVFVPAVGADAAKSPDWAEILGPHQGEIPPPDSYKVQWRSDLKAAMAEAQKKNRPLFVTMRCLPCKQCATFDKEVLEGGPDLDPVLLQFITVRLTDARDFDLRLFPVEGFQDLDLSWWSWILSPEGRIYSVYGGRDHLSDTNRVSKASLIHTLKSTLAWHYDPRREKWNVDRPIPDLSGPAKYPMDLPGYEDWKKLRPASTANNCIHCHQVADILRLPAIEAGTFNKRRDVYTWPLPDYLGLLLTRDNGLKIRHTSMRNSTAKEAGIQKSDVLAVADGQVLFSQADLRGVLHRLPKDAETVDVIWLRNGQPMSGTLDLRHGWRRSILDWRMSISQGVIGAGPTFFPQKVSDRQRTQLGIHPKSLAVHPFMGKNTTGAAYVAGLRSKDVVTAVNGMSPNVDGRGFLVWFRLKFEPGDQVTLSVRDEAGLPKEVTYTLPGRGE